jgi:hypothetical protein
MSPEQAIGRELDQRSDNYSLGVVFYEMMTGRVPFEDSGSGTSDYAIRKGHIELPVPPPSQFYPAISPELERILLTALEKNPENRFQSAREFLTAIEEFETTGIASGALKRGSILPRQTVVNRPSRSASQASLRASIALHARAGPTTQLSQLSTKSRPARSMTRLRGRRTLQASRQKEANASDRRWRGRGPADHCRARLVSELFTNNCPATGSTTNCRAPGMVRIPGAEFMMGRNDGSEYDFPAHKVTVKPFLIDETELTNDAYQQYVDATRSQTPKHWSNGRYVSGEATYPVVNVNWSEASAYCASLGKRFAHGRRVGIRREGK